MTDFFGFNLSRPATILRAMTDPHSPRLAQMSDAARPLWVVRPDELPDLLAGDLADAADWIRAGDFAARPGEVALIPCPDGVRGAVCGLGALASEPRRRFTLGSAVSQLPQGDWYLANTLDERDRDEAALAWLLAEYRFNRYSGAQNPGARLVLPEGADRHRLEAAAAAEYLTRDLINTPASDMGPDELEAAATALAGEFGAKLTAIVGDDLIDKNLPLIHTVGRASDRAPRLLDIAWGSRGPSLTLVGKGVCFDTGGLNLKSGAGMGLMKKDMGGAANVLGLARMIMALDLPLRLRVLIPAVENAVSGGSFRPSDILTARNGLTVEINNTDAEGRLVLADALALGAEAEPDLMISMATLTGAARVAVGPDIAPFYSTDDTLANELSDAAARVRDPVWRMPFWDPYEEMIEPGIADLDNAPKGGFGGSITAALFLRRFAGTGRYMHFDIYGWQPKPAPARPKGGVGQGIRAILEMLPQALEL
jgi:leucyl aminopeptidase